MTAPSAPALELRALHKAYGDAVAVDRLDLRVPAGAAFGLVGPNGAGKTTTLSMATGLLRPDGGTASVLGEDVWAAPARAKALLGVLPDGLALPERLTARELLRYVGLLRGMAPREVEARAEELLDVLDLARGADTLAGDLSAGMRKKLGLAQALLHAPRVLVLDEPLEAVDPVSAQTVRGILARFVAGGGTLVLSSHVMALVERLCTHVGVIADGRVVAAGTLEEVRAGGDLEERFAALVGARPEAEEALSWLA